MRLFKRTAVKDADENTAGAFNMANRAAIDDEELLILINEERRNIGLKAMSYKRYLKEMIDPLKKASEAIKETQKVEGEKKEERAKKALVKTQHQEELETKRHELELAKVNAELAKIKK